MGRSVTEWTAAYDVERTAEEFRKCGEKNFSRHFKIDYIGKSGNIIPIEMNSTAMHSTEGTVIQALCVDISERKRTEDALRASEEKFRLAFQTSPDSININRIHDGMYLDINEGFTKTMGYAREDIIGKTSLELNIWDDPKDRGRLLCALEHKGFVENMEARFRGKDGRISIGLMSARVLRIGKEDVILENRRDDFEVEFRMKKFFDKVVKPTFKGTYCVVYILPDTVSLSKVFNSYYDVDLRRRRATTAVARLQDYNSWTTNQYRSPLFILHLHH